ncbi:unnamed protein product [Periconia digitata]|uniref:Uncharacterized protein n=1 Tax=Periconia digitata TaxID=1303443 RepID=A0A9W4U546_9PLEO|nr:unnamed protein product [Periconia digitata]
MFPPSPLFLHSLPRITATLSVSSSSNGSIWQTAFFPLEMHPSPPLTVCQSIVAFHVPNSDCVFILLFPSDAARYPLLLTAALCVLSFPAFHRVHITPRST